MDVSNVQSTMRLTGALQRSMLERRAHPGDAVA
jgi:hypothetical protein